MNNDSHEILLNLNFCVIDLETTGGSHESDKIIEFGLVKISKLKITEQKNFLINPEKKIPEFIKRLTSISDKDVKDKPKIEDVLDEIIDFIGDDILVAHNTSFDIPFLNSVLKRDGRKKLENPVLCTNVMTKYLLPEITKSNLSYMCSVFEIELTQAHRAMEDATAAAKLLLLYLDFFEKKGIKKINQIYYPQNRFELDRTNYKKSEFIPSEFNLNIQVPCVLILKGCKGIILGILPLENTSQNNQIISDFLETIQDWEILTIKLTGNIFEGLLIYNSHFTKFNEKLRSLLQDFLLKKYSIQESKYDLQNIDVLLTKHYIKGQVNIYHCFNLNSNSKQIFKVPGQHKKLYNFLKKKILSFEKSQKGKRYSNIHHDVSPIFNNILSIFEKDFFITKNKYVKESEENFYKDIISFATTEDSDFTLKEIILK